MYCSPEKGKGPAYAGPRIRINLQFAVYSKMFLRTIVFTLVISSNVENTPSVPIPEYFQPPNGISNDLKNEAPLITAPPASIADATLKALFLSLIHI